MIWTNVWPSFPLSVIFPWWPFANDQANERPGSNVEYMYILIFGATLGPEGHVCFCRRKGGAVSELQEQPVAPKTFNKTQFGIIHRQTQSSLPINQYLDSTGQAKRLE